MLVVLGLISSANLFSKNVVDLYGTNAKKSEEIIKKYSNEVGYIENLLQENFRKISDNLEKEIPEKILMKKYLLEEKIKREGNFLFVNFSTILYPGDNNQYTTIEVIDKNQPDRLQFVNQRVVTASQPKDDLINKMVNFINLDLQLMPNNQKRSDSCPVYHCLSGFNHPKLKPYLKVFNTGAVKEKQLIADTLNKDPDPERRAAAAFLIGHFHDPKEILSLLLPHVNDQDIGVRNNVIRVIAATMSKSKITQIDLMPFLSLIDSPATTDRNKALHVLLNAADSESSKKVITQKGGGTLIALLQLKQPNNHQIAYLIFKKISGKDFGENNIAAWKSWLASVQSRKG